MKKYLVILLLIIIAACEENSVEYINTAESRIEANFNAAAIFDVNGNLELFWEDGYDNEIAYAIQLITDRQRRINGQTDGPDVTEFFFEKPWFGEKHKLFQISALFENTVSERVSLEFINPGSNYFLSNWNENSCLLNYQAGTENCSINLIERDKSGKIISTTTTEGGADSRFISLSDFVSGKSFQANLTLGDKNVDAPEIIVGQYPVSGYTMGTSDFSTGFVNDYIPFENNKLLVSGTDWVRIMDFESGTHTDITEYFDLPFTLNSSSSIGLRMNKSGIACIYNWKKNNIVIFDAFTNTKIRDVLTNFEIENLAITETQIYVVSTAGAVYKSNINSPGLRSTGHYISTRDLITDNQNNYWYSSSSEPTGISKYTMEGVSLESIMLVGSKYVTSINISPDNKTLIAGTAWESNHYLINCDDMSIIKKFASPTGSGRYTFVTNTLCLIQLEKKTYQLYDIENSLISEISYEKNFPINIGGSQDNYMVDIGNKEYYNISDHYNIVKGKIKDAWIIMYPLPD